MLNRMPRLPLHRVTAEEYLAALQLVELWKVRRTNRNIAWAIQLMRSNRG